MSEQKREPFYKYGKPLDSMRLKRGLDKRDSLEKASAFSRAIKPGCPIDRCPACDTTVSSPLVTIYGFDYRECSCCGSAYVSNPPSDEEIASAYRSDYYTVANKVLLANSATIDYRLDAVARPKVDFVLEHAKPKKMAWLDIGCGVGEIMAAAKEHGFGVTGLETNAMEADFAKSHFGIDVRQEHVTEATIPNYAGRFGIVSLFSVLEHVVAPRAILKTISHLQEVGDFLVIETPHFPSISCFSQMCFPEHVNRMMHPPLHLFLFSTAAIERMLAEAGYRIKAIWYFGQDLYEFISTMGLHHSQISNSRLHEALTKMTNDIQQTIDRSGLSDEMLIVAERVT